MSFNPQALNERTLKQFVDRLHTLRKSQPCPTEGAWPPKRSAIQEEIAAILGFTSWHHAIHAVRPHASATLGSPVLPSDRNPTGFQFPNEPAVWTGQAIRELLAWAAKDIGASDITFQTNEQILLEVNGRMHRASRRALTPDEIRDLVVDLYGSETALPILNNNGYLDFPLALPNKSRFRVNAVAIWIDGKPGVQITLRSVPEVPPQLGVIYPEMDDVLREALFRSRSGLNVISGATGSGKSTLLSSLIMELLATQENHKVGTYEAPVEFNLSSIHPGEHNSLSQTDISGIRGEFAAAVQNAVRRKLSDICLEVRDKDTVAECLAASTAGHKLWTILHSSGVGNVFRRLVSVFDQDERERRALEVINNVNVIVSQALVPTLNGTRTAIREVLVLDDQTRQQLIEAGVANLEVAVQRLLTQRKSRFVDDARRKHAKGIISQKTLDLYERSERARSRDLFLG